MKNTILVTFATLLFSANAFAVRTVECIPGQDTDIRVIVTFNRDIDPKKPFIGAYDWGATLKITKARSSNSYVNPNLRVTPIANYSDVNLSGNAAGVYLQLYPQFDSKENFTNYEGQLFVNDLDARLYFNFTDRDGITGLICK
jgi:hypothetical protein